MTRERRQFTPKEKVTILRQHLLENVPISDVCEKHGIQPTHFYRWQKQLFESGEAAFQQENHRQEHVLECRVEALEAKLHRKNEVMAELMEEHLLLKKNLGSLERYPGASRHSR